MAAVVLASAIPVVAAELSLSTRRGRMLWTISPHERRQVFYSQLMTDRTAAKEIRLFGLADFIRSRMMGELRQVNAAQRRLDRRVFHTQFALAALTAAVSSRPGLGHPAGTRRSPDPRRCDRFHSGRRRGADRAVRAGRPTGRRASGAAAVRPLPGHPQRRPDLTITGPPGARAAAARRDRTARRVVPLRPGQTLGAARGRPADPGRLAAGPESA